MIGWNSEHIFDIFYCCSANMNGMFNARKLQSVTKYIDTWSKSVNIFKTFERVQHPLPNSMFCLRYKLPEWQELSTQMQSLQHTTLKLGEGGLVSGFFWLSPKKIKKRGFEAGIHPKKIISILVADCMRQCFLIKFQNFWCQN